MAYSPEIALEFGMLVEVSDQRRVVGDDAPLLDGEGAPVFENNGVALERLVGEYHRGVELVSFVFAMMAS